MTARRGRTDVQEPISGVSIWMAVVGLAVTAVFILLMVGAVLLLNSQALPQTPLITGPAR
jgi:hypothetical protein